MMMISYLDGTVSLCIHICEIIGYLVMNRVLIETVAYFILKIFSEKKKLLKNKSKVSLLQV